MFNIGDEVYYIQSHSDELPCIKVGLVIPIPQGFGGYTNYVHLADPKYPDSFLLRTLLSLEDVSPDKDGAYDMLFYDIDERIKKLEANISALHRYKFEKRDVREVEKGRLC